MRVRYVIEIIRSKNSAKQDLDKTIQAIEKISNTKIEYTSTNDTNASIEVIYDENFLKQIEFSTRFLPTIIAVESLPKPIKAVDFWKQIININSIIGRLGTIQYGKKVNYKVNSDLDLEEYEQYIAEDRMNDVIFVLPSNADPAPYYDNGNIVIYDSIKNSARTIRVLGKIHELTFASFISRPIIVYPNEPKEYDFTIDEVNGILQSAAEITRILLMNALQNGLKKKLQR